MSKIEGATALITGASDGIGAAVARELGRQGALRIGLLARRSDKLEEVAASIRPHGAEVLVLTADVTRPDEVAQAVRTFLDTWGPPDLLVCNAGIGDCVTAERFDPQRVMRVMEVNYGGVVQVLGAMLPALLARGQGHVVVTSSLAARRGLPTAGSYSASKAAIDRLIEGLRPELARAGIRCTLLAPGFIRTELTAPNRFKMPMLLEPDEAARRIVRAIRRGPRRAAFPWPMAALMDLLGLLPDSLFDLLMSRVSPAERRQRAPAA